MLAVESAGLICKGLQLKANVYALRCAEWKSLQEMLFELVVPEEGDELFGVEHSPAAPEEIIHLSVGKP